MLFGKKILILDNNILVYLSELCQNCIYQVIPRLFLTYSHIFIPKTIYDEFLAVSKSRKKRERILNEIFERYQHFLLCPVNVSKNELSLINIDPGEADAYMQIKKLDASDQYRFENIVFLTNDAKAIKIFENSGIDIYKYSDLVDEFREIGIILPSFK